MTAGRCQHGERPHHPTNTTGTAPPGAGFVMGKAQFVLAGFKTVLNVPSLSFHRHQRLDAGASRAPSGEVGAFTISQIAPDQQAAGPQPVLPAVVFAGIEISQVQIALVLHSTRLRRTEPLQASPNYTAVAPWFLRRPRGVAKRRHRAPA